MHRVYVPREELRSGSVRLDPSESRHLARVLRVGRGAAVTVFDGAGAQAPATVAAVERDGAVVLDVGGLCRMPEPVPRIALAQALPRGPRFELILEKATELGVARVIPLLSERCVVRLPAGGGMAKRRHWQQILVNAGKQSGTLFLPRLDPVRPVLEFLAEPPTAECRLVAALSPDSRPLWELLAPAPAGPPADILIMVGPEGDFTPVELGAARARGFRPLSLGPQVLRSETAALCAVATAAYELARRGAAAPLPRPAPGPSDQPTRA